MTRNKKLALLLFLLVTVAFAAAVGDGAATPAIRASFIQAYTRGQFSLYVNAPTAIKALGSPGLVQEFPATANTALKYALIKPDPNAPLAQFDTLQVSPDIYTPYTAVGATTAGYPTMDTAACPANGFGTCNYQLFTKNYAIFAYSEPVISTFTVADPFYSVWNTTGGLGGILGLPTSGENAVTSISKVAGTQQTYLGGAIYTYPAGSTTAAAYSVSGAFFTAWTASGGYASLGFPTAEAALVGATGMFRQTFEAGRIEQTPGNDPGVLFPVSLVGITSASQGLSLLPGGATTVSASTLDTRGNTVTNRAMSWSSTNGAVATVTGNGYSAKVQGISAGAANIYVTVEGKTSLPISVRVGGACCLVGEGAPTPVMTQAFQAALDRNQLAATLPVAGLVARTGDGYIQTVTAGGSAYVVSLATGAASAYLSSGAIYSAYLAAGGFSGPLGYPVSDALPGLQRYSSGAVLVGSPVRLVPAGIAGKWLAGGGVAGALGLPVSDAVPFQSILNTAGSFQAFAGGAIYAVTVGSKAGGVAYTSAGPVLARYLALGGTGGALGAPVSDLANGRQDFETGYIDLPAGAAVAVEHFFARKPTITVTPATVVPGGRVHVSATSFALGSKLNFSVTGQANFTVPVPAGVFAWDILVPATARPGTVTVQATAAGAADAASATYTVASAASLLPGLTLVSGDQQTGAPGSRLLVPLVVSLLDATGAPLAGVPVGWNLSPGAAVTGDAVTDANGRASGFVRLPAHEGVSLGAVSAAGKVVSFSALATARALAGFPAFPQSAAGGTLAATLASLLRYQQNQGILGAPRGLATVAGLEQYLQANNGYAPSDHAILMANPWVGAGFAGAGLVLDPANPDGVRDAVAAGQPVALALTLQVNGAAAGTTFVAAIGVNADGSLAISDPDPTLARTSLADYLTGFSVGGTLVKGTLGGVLRLTASVPPVNRITFATPLSAQALLAAQALAGSGPGSCTALDLHEAGDASGTAGLRFHYCEKGASYELDLVAGKGGSVLDLVTGTQVPVPADAHVAFQVALPINAASSTLTVVPQRLTLASVTDAAAFGTALAPGSILSIFGTGLGAGGKAPTVTLGGRTLPVLYVSPFQMNAVIPADVVPGTLSLSVTGPLGSATLNLYVTATGPAIFVLGSRPGGWQGAILNQDGTLNSPDNPAARGSFVSVYATGGGATALRNGLQATVAPITVSLNGAPPLATSWAGAVAGFVGLYQINVQIPATTAPGLASGLTIQADGKISNSVLIALQ